MATRGKTLSPTSVTVLDLIASGRTYEQILSLHPELTYLGIFEAAREALNLDGGARREYDRRLAEIRRAHPRAYEQWSSDEDARLTTLVRAGESVEQISHLLQRQPTAINSRLMRLGLVSDGVSSKDRMPVEAPRAEQPSQAPAHREWKRGALSEDEQTRRNQAAIELLDSWLDGDEEDERDQRETWEFLKKALNEDRLSDRDRVP